MNDSLLILCVVLGVAIPLFAIRGLRSTLDLQDRLSPRAAPTSAGGRSTATTAAAAATAVPAFRRTAPAVPASPSHPDRSVS